MALNYSHRHVLPVFPPHTTEDNVWSPMRMVNGYLSENAPAKNFEGFSRPWYVNRGETDEWPFSFKGDVVDHHHRCCSSESNSKDIVDLLPSDPFGMDIETTVTAISGWLEDLEIGYGGRSNTGTSTSHENYSLLADLIWNNALTFQPFHCKNNKFKSEKPCDEKLKADSDNGGVIGCSNEKLSSVKSELQFGEKAEGGGLPHEALVPIMSCLGIKDILSVETVSKSLCLTIRSDPWLWKNIYIDKPLNEKITDDALLQLTSRADGKLECLSLMECPKVTDDGVRRVVEMNPHLTKLFVLGCLKITIEGMLNIIKTHNSNKANPGIHHLRLGRLWGVTREHFEELESLVGPDYLRSENCQKPHLYHRGNCYLPFDDDRALDIEMCPRCENFRLVYDCPAEACQVKGSAVQTCRACRFCIARCAQCGRCFIDNDYEETFCLDLLCSDCVMEARKSHELREKKIAEETLGSRHEPSYYS